MANGDRLEDGPPRVSRWIVSCTSCGRQGLSMTSDWRETASSLAGFGAWFKPKLFRVYDPLPLDAAGLCAECRRAANRRGAS
jgi:hypothetical protein